MHCFFGKFVFAGLDFGAILFPAFIQGHDQDILFCVHIHQSASSSLTPKISSNRARCLFRLHFSSIRSPLPCSVKCQDFLFSAKTTPVTRPIWLVSSTSARRSNAESFVTIKRSLFGRALKFSSSSEGKALR